MSLTDLDRQMMRDAIAHPLEDRPWREWLSLALDAWEEATSRAESAEAGHLGAVALLEDAEAKVRRVEALRDKWENTPALRRGTAATLLRAALAGDES